MAGTYTISRSAADYTIACICPMGVELAPVEAMLDEQHASLPFNRGQNVYTLGMMSGHNIVIAVMPKTGNNIAAVVATQLLNDFPSIHYTFLVGIGGGVPGDVDVRLGDVVVGQGGVIQYDLGKRVQGGKLERTGSISKPPLALSASIQKLDSQYRRLGNQLTVLVDEMLQRYPEMQAKYSFPIDVSDNLFPSSYPHKRPNDTCYACDRRRKVRRPERMSDIPYIHYGVVGSANVVMKDAVIREDLRRDTNVLCVEMEAAGLMDSFPCLVIRGICDYADSHKNKHWQPYAAAVAAAYMKELLSVIVPRQLMASGVSMDLAQHSGYNRGLNLFDAPELDGQQFVGREDIIAQMQAKLHSSGEYIDRKVLVLGGMGGFGKTQLAIRYAKQHRGLYSSIFWLNATSELTIKSSLRLIIKRILPTVANSLNDDEIHTTVFNWLSEPDNNRWLLIFDNYDEPNQYPINIYYPYVSQGSIIITSRLPDQVSGRTIQLAVPSFTSIDDSLEILSRRSARSNVHQDTSARRLAKRLAGLPLALATAGAFLHQSKSTWSFEQYLEIYERQWHIDPHRPLRLSEYDKTLYTTWNLSFKHLEAHDPVAAQVLKLLAYFDHQAIWYDLFHAGTRDDLPQWLQNISKDPASFEGVIRVLVDHCFLDVQTSISAYTMHACIHDWTLAELNSTLDASSYWFAFDCVALSMREEDWENLGLTRFASLTPHAARLASHKFHKIRENVSEARYGDARFVARLLKEHALYDLAAVIYTWTLASSEQNLGFDDTSTLDTVNHLGILYRHQGKLAEAERMYLRALAGREKVFGMEHESTLLVVNNLGTLYKNQDRLEEAERMLLRAVNGHEKLFGVEHLSTLHTYNSLGGLYARQGRSEDAKRMFLLALAGRQRLLGEEHILVLQIIGNLASVHHSQGSLEKSEQMYEQALAGKEMAIGPNHPSTFHTVDNLASLYIAQGNLEKAERMALRALAGYEKVLGPDHTSTTSAVAKVASIYARQGKVAIAEQMFLRALTSFEQAVGRDHISTKRVISDLEILRSSGLVETTTSHFIS